MPRRWNPYRLALLGIVFGLLLLATLYVVGLAWWQASSSPFLEFRRLIGPRLIDLLMVGWVLWVGSSVGSFLNVVAYRMPLGKSVGGRSYCPRCHVRLAARDNFPVFGWLALGGRCRSCRLPISSRYPTVEAIVGVTLAFVGISELYRLALPHDVGGGQWGVVWTPRVDPKTITTALYHIIGVSTAWAVGLIAWDKNRLPSRLVGFALLVVLVPILAWPPLMIVSWRMQTIQELSVDDPLAETLPTPTRLDGVMRLITALAAAAMMARTLARGVCPSADPKLDPLGADTKRLIDLIVVIAIPAVLVGWQAVLAVIAMAGLIAWWIGNRRWNQTDALGRLAIAVPISLSIQIAFWRMLSGWSFWPSETADPFVLMAWAVVVLISPLWLSDRELPKSEPASDPS
ncbi:MAG: prepilin peptidase [Planctomycetota bacterium]